MRHINADHSSGFSHSTSGEKIVQRNAQNLPQIYRWPAPARYGFYALLALLYFYRGNFSRIPFVYFQF